VGNARVERLLLAVVLMLFAILLTLVGGGTIGLVIGGVALVLALLLPLSRS
jgi:hypothetical protein